VESAVTTVLLDSHVVHWLADEPERLSPAAAAAIAEADELAVAAISWVELAWLGARERLILPIPLRAWLEQLARDVRTVPLTPAIAARAAELPRSFPRDPSDRLIYAAAIEHGWRLVTKDLQLRAYDTASAITIW
jgi:PIN domain nuclease of toxin-antitoxin system